MSDRKNYEPAFPCDAIQIDNRVYASTGMTLRDYFAAKALQGLLASNAKHNHEDAEIFDILGEASYKVADAMLEARAK